jgi:hypothetical protein
MDIESAVLHHGSTDQERAREEQEVLAKKFIAVNSIVELKAIMSKENIVIPPGRKTKVDYVKAIYLARHPSPST